MPIPEKLISPPACKVLHQTIQESRGNEVFFLAKTDEEGVVLEVLPLARGNDSSVPALLQVAIQGDVIIHNHPSGHLTPSSADVSLASTYGNQGVGFYIINNDATDVYIVVAAFKRQQIQLLDVQQLRSFLSSSGAISAELKNFESRPEQQAMLGGVTQAFNESKLALIEAGTGTGKSLAYLLPAITWAVQNRQRVVISTNTINLQEQLIHKDLPLLQKALPLRFKPVLIKGRQNYVCLSKVDVLEKEGEFLIETDEMAELKSILQWAHQTSDGSRSDLNILPRASTWEKVACESDNCARLRCSFYNSCFFYNARREAASADILVVNHHLLFADLAVRGQTGQFSDSAVLPGYSRLVLDEAHNVEEVATNYFGAQISKSGLLRLLNRIYSIREREKIRERGLLPLLLARLKNVQQEIGLTLYTRIVDHVQRRLLPLREEAMYAVTQTFDDLADYVERQQQVPTPDTKVRFAQKLIQQPEWKTRVLPQIQILIQSLGDLHQQLLSLEGWLETLPENVLDGLTSSTVELGALSDRLEGAAAILGEIFGDWDPTKVRWVEINRGSRIGPRVMLRQAPLEIADLLRERAFEKLATVVLTSATLAIENKFDYVRRRLGLDGIDPTRQLTLLLPSSFDYARQVIIGIPQDIPAPEDPQFAAELGQLVWNSIQISEGRALVLFTSYSLLKKIFEDLVPLLAENGIRGLMQGDAPRHHLTQLFKQESTSVLFATDSYWEGVDVAGDALENVILTRLPFGVPKEPMVEARIEALEQAGRNSFLEYSVPQAVIKFKQGFGRLIRSKRDFGSIMVFDRRIIEKQYGKIFLRSLPACPVVRGRKSAVFEEVRRFFEKRRARVVF